MGVWRSSQQMEVNGTSVRQEMSTTYRKDVEVNRRNIRRILELILVMGRQNIALTGHDESGTSVNKGNFLELLQYVSKDCRTEEPLDKECSLCQSNQPKMK
jgi:hypothetical protein